MRKAVYEAHARGVNYHHDIVSQGELIRVGIVDSVYQSSPDWNCTIAERVNFVASDVPDTTGHGIRVLSLLIATSPEAEFHLYRTVAEDRKFKPQNLLKAFDSARKSQVDVLNISAGRCRPNCSEDSRCRLCSAAKEITDAGVRVVAGAGNRAVDSSRSLFCPARQNEVIAVGSSEAICTTDLRPSMGMMGPRMKPPGAYWLEYSSKSDELPFVGTECYCGRSGCAPGIECECAMVERPSRVNVGYERGSPDVLAPDHCPYEEPDGSPIIDTGTSYSSPIVAGCIASILGELFNQGSIPDPHDTKRAVVRNTVPIDKGDVGKFDMTRVYRALIGHP